MRTARRRVGGEFTASGLSVLTSDDSSMRMRAVEGLPWAAAASVAGWAGAAAAGDATGDAPGEADGEAPVAGEAAAAGEAAVVGLGASVGFGAEVGETGAPPEQAARSAAVLPTPSIVSS